MVLKKNIILLSIAICGFGGYITAIRSHQQNGMLFCTSEFDSLNPTYCPDILEGHSLTGAALAGRSSCTKEQGGQCPETDIYLAEAN
jgi:hypothetical protein